MLATANQVEEEKLVREKVAEIALPTGVKFLRVEPYVDWTGDPSLRLYFSVSKRRPLTPKSVRELSAAMRSVEEAVISLGLGKFPYYRLLESR
jgi:hypothetical protein